MTIRMTPPRVRFTLLAMLGCLPVFAFAPDPPKDDKRPPRTQQAWTREEALEQLKLYPNDPYLQYVALQLGRREGPWSTTVSEVERLAAVNRRDQVDLFGVFTGALAVQESLQLDRMRPGPDRRDEPPARAIIDIATLRGPTIKSHPWKQMLGDKKPDISPLSRMVPEDFYFVEFRSLNKMLDVLDAGDLWSLHLFDQAKRDARTQHSGERLRQQLVIKTNRLLRPFYDTVVEDVAVTGSDLFVAEGSDVTLLFRAKQADVLQKRMDGFLDDTVKTRKDVKRTEGEYLGVRYVHLSTPERDIHVFSAYPEPRLHVRSNSKAGLRRVLEAIKGQTLDGKPVHRLGDSTEFAYIRTLMPRGAKEEDGFICLSDPFIRHLVGPTLKLTERRRMLCYNHLRMIGHAAMMYRTEYGQAPKSLAELERAECCPGAFNKDDLVCMDGGKYSLSADGTNGVCSHHGHARTLVPCAETPLAWVFPDEAKEYENFLTQYNNYWRTYFDPIALRIQVTPQRYRLETIVLPLINNSIYTGLERALRGKPEPLDALPVPKRNIFSVAAHINKAALLEDVAPERNLRQTLGLAEGDVRELLTRGLGDAVSLHLCDSELMFDLDLPRFFNLMFNDFNLASRKLSDQDVLLTFMVASLNSPVYLAFPVRDAKIVDRFLNELDKVLTVKAREQQSMGWFSFGQDFYKSKLAADSLVRSYSFSLGPVKWRFHWARIGKGLYVASKPDILKDLVEAETARAEGKEAAADADATAHALVRLRARNWNAVLPDYRLGWAENNRQACLRNLGPLTSAGRAVVAQSAPGPERDGAALGQAAQRLADQMYAVHFFCPEGGHYVLAPDGRSCSCSVHGSARNPKQPLAANDRDGSGKLLHNFGGLTASLTFLDDGLHAVVLLERRK
jgi:hypothetical protein